MRWRKEKFKRQIGLLLNIHILPRGGYLSFLVSIAAFSLSSAACSRKAMMMYAARISCTTTTLIRVDSGKACVKNWHTAETAPVMVGLYVGPR